MIQNKEKLTQVANRWLRQNKLTNLSLVLARGEDEWKFTAGEFQSNASFFVASTTKLFITALFMQLQVAGRLDLDDRIATYLAPGFLNQLHVWRGKEYSKEISFKHLLSQTSGLADYFEQAPAGKQTLRSSLMLGADRAWTLQDIIEISKSTRAKFSPGYKRKALYSDTNYQLLGHTLENMLDQDLASILTERIAQPLGLEQTYLFSDPADTTPAPLHYKRRPLHIPNAMTSFGPDGGIVSTSADLMCFIKAFFGGALFPQHYLQHMRDWRNIFFPLQYGVGIARFRLPRIFTLFSSDLEWIGHSGVSGAFAFYCPQRELYLTGTVNEIHPPSLPFKLIVKLTNVIKK